MRSKFLLKLLLVNICTILPTRSCKEGNQSYVDRDLHWGLRSELYLLLLLCWEIPEVDWESTSAQDWSTTDNYATLFSGLCILGGSYVIVPCFVLCGTSVWRSRTGLPHDNFDRYPHKLVHRRTQQSDGIIRDSHWPRLSDWSVAGLCTLQVWWAPGRLSRLLWNQCASVPSYGHDCEPH